MNHNTVQDLFCKLTLYVTMVEPSYFHCLCSPCHIFFIAISSWGSRCPHAVPDVACGFVLGAGSVPSLQCSDIAIGLAITHPKKTNGV